MPYYIKRTKAKKKDKPLPLFDKAGITIKKKPDLKAKLDKEFSLFIRLRDAMPNGDRLSPWWSVPESRKRTGS